MKSPNTWVLIADGARARLVTAKRSGKTFDISEHAQFSADHSPNRDLQRDDKPRVFESQGSTRHAIEPRTDPHRELKRDFAGELARVLEGIVTREHIEALVIAATPVTLGDLRKALSDRVNAVVVGEVDKDLTKVPNADLGSHLRDVIPL